MHQRKRMFSEWGNTVCLPFELLAMRHKILDEKVNWVYRIHNSYSDERNQLNIAEKIIQM